MSKPFVNTHLLREEAERFMRYGYYCDAPQGTKDYYEYWSEQLRRCRDGYSVGGMHITGHHYGYMNFAQIQLTDESATGKKLTNARKTVSFPHFWDGDYEYFHLVEIARNGMEKSAYEKLGLDTRVFDLRGGLNVIVGKARRKGFSYKNGWIAANNFNTHKDMTTLIGAHEKKFLYPEGTMSMATNYINFLSEHTAWTKRRQAVDKQDHKRASYYEYINGHPVEKGYKSQIIAVTFKDNPDAARGKDADLIVLDECGAFDNLKATYAATLPTVKDGALTTGQILMYGTGGDMEGGTIDFESMFYNPEPYELLPVENIWDEGAEGTKCGYFFPDNKNKVGFIDKNGNSKLKEAKDHEEAIRAHKKATTKDPSAVDKYCVEHAFNPREAFMQISSNIFPVGELNEWRNKLSTSNVLSCVGVPGSLISSSEGAKFRPDSSIRPVYKFPHDRGDDIRGGVVQFQAPFKIDGKVPPNLYIIVHDPYGTDSENGRSLGAAYVIKRVNNYSSPDDMIVASYVGRPGTQDEYNRTLFQLSEYYNAKIGFENDRGEVVPFAKRFRKLNRLMEEPEIIDLKENIKIKTLGRKFGMSMGSAQRKGQAELYLRDWLITPRGKAEDGKPILNLHYIYDMALIDELIKYNSKGNFDRVSSLLVGMWYLKYMYNKQVKAATIEDDNPDSFFNRSWF